MAFTELSWAFLALLFHLTCRIFLSILNFAYIYSGSFQQIILQVKHLFKQIY